MPQSTLRSRKAEAGNHTKPVSKSSGGKSLRRYVLMCCSVAFSVVIVWMLVRHFTAPAHSTPEVYGFRVVRKYPHDPRAFTQGLLWLNGSLYESLGLYGRSAVREVRLEDGKVLRQVKCNKSEFGEGLVHRNGELLQLLWQVNDVIAYSVKSGDGGHLKRKRKQFKTPLTDGWGLETDGESLLVTDNGPDIFFLDPETYENRRQVRVSDDGRAVQMVNELEMIDGEVWANVFGVECLARISPSTGEVVSWVVLDGLLDRRDAEMEARRAGRDPPDVLNGIAWDPEGKRLFVTGKLWPTLFELELAPATVTLEQARSRCIPPRNIFRG